MLKFFNNIKKFQGLCNSSCCIAGTGPSLEHIDFSKINMPIIGTNGFYNHPRKADFFCVCDNHVWENHKEKIINKYYDTPTFISVLNFNSIYYKNLYYINPLPFGEWDYSNWGDLKIGAYRDCTVIVFALQVAFYLGFQDVYLIGCDCDYSGIKKHFDASPVDNFERVNWEPVFDVYKKCKMIYEANNKNIYNSTIGGNLEVFERKKI